MTLRRPIEDSQSVLCAFLVNEFPGQLQADRQQRGIQLECFEQALLVLAPPPLSLLHFGQCEMACRPIGFLSDYSIEIRLGFGVFSLRGQDLTSLQQCVQIFGILTQSLIQNPPCVDRSVDALIGHYETAAGRPALRIRLHQFLELPHCFISPSLGEKK